MPFLPSGDGHSPKGREMAVPALVTVVWHGRYLSALLQAWAVTAQGHLAFSASHSGSQEQCHMLRHGITAKGQNTSCAKDNVGHRQEEVRPTVGGRNCLEVGMARGQF